MKKIVITCGIIAGLIVSVVLSISIISYNKNPEAMKGTGSMIIGYLSMLVAFSLIFVGVKNYRDKENGGYISFGKAFKTGFFISLIASTIYVIVWAILYNFFVPDFMEKYSEMMVQQATKTGSQAAVQEQVAEMDKYKEMYKNPLFFALMTYAEILPVGLLVSLICAFILKRKSRTEPLVTA